MLKYAITSQLFLIVWLAKCALAILEKKDGRSDWEIRRKIENSSSSSVSLTQLKSRSFQVVDKTTTAADVQNKKCSEKLLLFIVQFAHL